MAIRTSEKTRQAAMKRYFKYAVNNGNLCELYPYYCYETDTVDGSMELFNIFCDGKSFVMTRENISPELEVFQDKITGQTYPFGKMIDDILRSRQDLYSIIKADIHRTLEKAKELGYRYKMSEIGNSQDFTYVWNYENTYGKIGILDQAFKIIDDGEPAWIWNDGFNRPLILETSIGICGVLSMYYKPHERHKIIGIGKVTE